MTKTHLIPLSACLLAILGTVPAVAQDTGRSTRTVENPPTNTMGRWSDADTSRPSSLIPLTSYGYVGINGGISDFGLPGCRAGASCDETDIGFKVYAGGQFSRIFGVELSYVDLGRLDRNGGDVRAKGVNLGLVANLPLTEQLNVFGKIGAVYGWTRTGSPLPGVATGNKSDMNLSYGAGAQFDINRNWAIRGDWDAYRMEFAGGRDTVSLLSIGGVYKF